MKVNQTEKDFRRIYKSVKPATQYLSYLRRKKEMPKKRESTDNCFGTWSYRPECRDCPVKFSCKRETLKDYHPAYCIFCRCQRPFKDERCFNCGKKYKKIHINEKQP